MTVEERAEWRRGEYVKLDRALRGAAARRETLHVFVFCKSGRHRSVAWSRVLCDILARAGVPAGIEDDLCWWYMGKVRCQRQRGRAALWGEGLGGYIWGLFHVLFPGLLSSIV